MDFYVPQMETKCVFVLVAILFLALVSGQDSGLSGLSLSNPKKICGEYLTEELSIVCKGKYNALKVLNKRSLSYTNVEGNVLLIPRPRYPFVPKKSAISIVKSLRRLKRGVANECCEKSCTRTELQSYCQI